MAFLAVDMKASLLAVVKSGFHWLRTMRSCRGLGGVSGRHVGHLNTALREELSTAHLARRQCYPQPHMLGRGRAQEAGHAGQL